MILDLFSLVFWWVEYKNGFLCLFGMGRNMVKGRYVAIKNKTAAQIHIVRRF